MKRSLKFSLNFANTEKQKDMDSLWLEYSRVVNLFLDTLCEKKELSEHFIKSIDTKLSYRYRQCAKRQAINIYKVYVQKKKAQEKPILKSSMTLDRRFISLEKSKNSFDYWVKIATLNSCTY